MVDTSVAEESQNQETILTANTNDQATPADHLGFEPYVSAVAAFLTNKDTHPPLVLSIEGEWGSGKTSFMLQLQKALRERKENFTIWFNPWRHDKEDALWAAFALEFIRGLSVNQPFYRRWRGHIRLFALRFKWQEGWLSLVQKISLWLLILGATITIGVLAFLNRGVWIQALATFAENVLKIQEGADLLGKGFTAGGAAAYLALLFTVLNRIRSFVGDPLAIDLKKYMQVPNYEERVSFVERFHEDFKYILDCYARGKTVYVFIDDVDRCEVPKAADLMSALNLMISGNTPLVFIIGMDREKVAAGLAVKHEKLLPYMYASRYGATDETAKFQSTVGLEYGYEFIEKFVQLPFLLPRPDDAALTKFLDELSQPSRPGPDPQPQASSWTGLWTRLFGLSKRAAPTRSSTTQRASVAEESQEVNRATLARRQSVIVQAGNDSKHIHAIVRLVAPAFDNNPRRIKQYINLLRLRIFIAAATGLFDEQDGTKALTMEQLGKFVAILLRWPILLAEMDVMPRILVNLQKFAVEPPSEEQSKDISPIVRRWIRRQDFMTFLANGVRPDTLETSPWSLAGINVPQLLQVLPQVRNIGRYIGENVGVPVSNARTPQRTDFGELGLAQPITQTMTTYVFGDDLYDESFSIDSKGGEFLGEYGVQVSHVTGNDTPKKVFAFEIWLFDKNDIKTSVDVLLSAHANNTPEIRSSLEPKGRLVVAKPQEQSLLETATLQALWTVVDIEYGNSLAAPPNSYFERVTLEIAVWPRTQA
jgi:KAP-like P-loop domain-containing protein